MQAVDLNLASRPFKNDTLLWLVLGLGVGFVGYATWWNVNVWHEHRQLVAKLEDSRASLDERFDQLEVRDREALRAIDGYDLPAILVKTDKANELIRWKAFSWTELFNQLQEVLPSNVQMSSIHPVFRVERRQPAETVEDLSLVPVAVEGVAKDLRDLLEFERNLIAHPQFARPEPDRWTTDENSEETLFRLRFLYDPEVVEEALPVDAEQLAETAEPEEDDAGVEDDLDVAEADDGAQDPTGAPSLPEPTGELAADRLTKITRGAKASDPTSSEKPVPALDGSEVRTPGPDWGADPDGAGDDSDELEGGRR